MVSLPYASGEVVEWYNLSIDSFIDQMLNNLLSFHQSILFLAVYPKEVCMEKSYKVMHSSIIYNREKLDMI